MKGKTIIKIFTIALMILSLAGCNVEPEVKMGNLCVVIDSLMVEKTIAPEDSAITVGKYVLYGNRRESDASFRKESTKGTFEIKDILIGTWDIYAEGYNATGSELLAKTDTLTLTVEANKTPTATLSLSYNTDGEGKFKLDSLIQSSDGSASYFAIDIQGITDSEYSYSEQIENTTGTISKELTLPTGKYDISFSILDSSKNKLGASYEESLHIYKNKTSSISLPWTDGLFMKTAAPFFSLIDGNTFLDGAALIISYDDNAKVYYTLDGSAPTSESPVYEEPIVLPGSVNVKAYAQIDGLMRSEVTSASYYIKAKAPSFSVTTLIHEESFELELTSASANSEIYYTFGDTAYPDGWNLYTGPITIDTHATIKAIAVKDNQKNSDIVTQSYQFKTQDGNVEIQTPVINSVEISISSNPENNADTIYGGLDLVATASPGLDNVSYTWLVDGIVVDGVIDDTFSIGNRKDDEYSVEAKSYSVTVIAENANEIVSDTIAVHFMDKIFEMGEVGPAGGYIFYDCDADNTLSDPNGADNLKSDVCGWRYLEAAPGDLRLVNGVLTVDPSYPEYESAVGNSSLYTPYFIFGYYRLGDNSSNLFSNGTTVYNALNCTGTAIGTGKSNTELLISRMGESTYSNYGYSADKTSDYGARVCSILEHNSYDDWFLPSKDELSEMYRVLKCNGISNFRNAVYLSSSESSTPYHNTYGAASGVYAVYFYQEGYTVDDRSTSDRIHPIRAF